MFLYLWHNLLWFKYDEIYIYIYIYFAWNALFNGKVVFKILIMAHRYQICNKKFLEKYVPKQQFQTPSSESRQPWAGVLTLYGGPKKTFFWFWYGKQLFPVPFGHIRCHRKFEVPVIILTSCSRPISLIPTV